MAAAGMPGELILVQGVNSGAGRSTVALNLAFELAGMGARVCLVDLDAQWPSLHKHLALNQQQASVLAACRFLEQGKLDANAYESLVVRVVAKGASIDFLSGYGLDHVGDALSGESLTQLMQHLLAKYDYVVADTAIAAAFQNAPAEAAAATVIAQLTSLASKSVIVTLSDPISLGRFVESQGVLQVAPAAILVVNRFRQSALGGRPHWQLQQVLSSNTGHTSAALIPEDAEFDAAMLQGVPLRQVSTKTPAFKAIGELALTIRG
jgi:MinD-like ATPase involved in chromosome partitioning or flagellar assembly